MSTDRTKFSVQIKPDFFSAICTMNVTCMSVTIFFRVLEWRWRQRNNFSIKFLLKYDTKEMKRMIQINNVPKKGKGTNK